MANSNLVTIFNGSIQNQSVQLCNARELHQFLESKREYATWIKDRISDYGFTENEDYIIVTERTNGRPRKEYHITLDMGKELGMVERNEKGRQIRKYFIACEKRLKELQNPQPNLPLVVEKKYTLTLTEDELRSLAWLWKSAERMRNILALLYKPLELLGSKFSAAVYGSATEYKRTLEQARKILVRETNTIETDKWDSNNWNNVLHELRKGELRSSL